MLHEIARAIVLDSAGVDGPTEEVTQAVALNGDNAIQLLTILLVLTGTNVSVQYQTSNDSWNFSPFGNAQTLIAIGRKDLVMDTSVGAAYVRVKFSITGTGKAILDAHLNTSVQ